MGFRSNIGNNSRTGFGVEPPTGFTPEGFSISSLDNLALYTDEGLISDGGVALNRSSTQYLHRMDDDTFDVGANDFTVGGWIYMEGTVDNQRIISKFHYTSDDRSWVIDVDNSTAASGSIRSFVSTNGSNSLAIEGTTQLSVDTWYFCVFRRNGDDLDVFLNASVDGSGSMTNISGDSLYNSPKPLNVGANDDGGSSLNGKLDSVFFIETALSNAEIAGLYNSGNGHTWSSVPQAIKDKFNNNNGHWWDLNEEPSATSNTWFDSAGSADLTGVNSPTLANGITAGQPTEAGDTIMKIEDISGNNAGLIQTTAANKPWYSSTLDGMVFQTDNFLTWERAVAEQKSIFQGSWTIMVPVHFDDGQPGTTEILWGVAHTGGNDNLSFRLEPDGDMRIIWTVDGVVETFRTSSAVFSDRATTEVLLTVRYNAKTNTIEIRKNKVSLTLDDDTVNSITPSNFDQDQKMVFGAIRDNTGGTTSHIEGEIKHPKLTILSGADAESDPKIKGSEQEIMDEHGIS